MEPLTILLIISLIALAFIIDQLHGMSIDAYWARARWQSRQTARLLRRRAHREVRVLTSVNQPLLFVDKLATDPIHAAANWEGDQ